MDNLTSLFKANPLSHLTIRMRIILFSVLVTFIPAAGLGWLFYSNNKEMLTENTNHELVTATTAAKLALSQWLQSREYDLQAFSGSFVLTENLSQYYRNPNSQLQIASDINAYFTLLLDQFPSVTALMLFDKSGNVVASSAEALPDWRVPESSFSQDDARATAFLTVNPQRAQIIVGIPLYANTHTISGWLASSLPLSQLTPVMLNTLTDDISNWMLVNTIADPTVFLQGSSKSTAEQWSFQASQLTRAISKPGDLIEIRDDAGTEVYAVSAGINDMPISLLLLRSKSEIFANIDRLKYLSLLFSALLMTVTGILALALARSILSPIVELKAAAVAVSQGNLSVSVRQISDDELGQVIQVFNEMVTHLSESHDRLEKLSITDPLTGLFNRKRMLSVLSKSIERYKRYHQVFSILMVDIDFFKKVNDEYGHQAGDAVLEKMGVIFQQELRTIDVAARYGGEEFIILLDQIDVPAAFQTAERIRMAVEGSTFSHNGFDLRCTLSVGVSSVADVEQTELGIIAEADAALYQAKGQGRNCTVIASRFSQMVTELPRERRKK